MATRILSHDFLAAIARGSGREVVRVGNGSKITIDVAEESARLFVALPDVPGGDEVAFETGDRLRIEILCGGRISRVPVPVLDPVESALNLYGKARLIRDPVPRSESDECVVEVFQGVSERARHFKRMPEGHVAFALQRKPYAEVRRIWATADREFATAAARWLRRNLRLGIKK